MGVPRTNQSDRPRELRRRVVLPARLRMGLEWSDTCILNISSRGLLIHSARAGPKGSTVELRRGEHVITARVVWRDGSRIGLQSDDRLPVDEILSLGKCRSLQLVASGGELVERRKRPREESDRARLWGRSLEFVAVVAFALGLGVSGFLMAQQAFGRPMAMIKRSLAG